MKPALLNTIAVAVLVLGMGSAILVYEAGVNRGATSKSAGDWQDGSLTLTDSKANTHDIELYSGQLGVLMAQAQEWLQHPESQALIIAAFTTLIALVCFLAARHFR